MPKLIRPGVVKFTWNELREMGMPEDAIHRARTLGIKHSEKCLVSMMASPKKFDCNGACMTWEANNAKT